MTRRKKTLAIILGIRPDVIRASLLLRRLRSQSGPDCAIRFIWSGQHYSDNLKDIFLRELGVQAPEIELGATGTTDAEISASVISRLYPVLEEMKPEAAVFLGDTNTVVGCLAAAQLNVPIVHIEGGMRSYDWRMPEEKYRTVTDHLSDVIYAYLDEYKANGVAEGLNPANILVTGNPIVDVLETHYFGRPAHYEALATPAFFRSRGLVRGDYYVMTCHRRENVCDADSLRRIVALTQASGRKIFFPAGYRTQRELRAAGLTLSAHVVMTDPIGYDDLLALMTNSCGVLTDSGTVVEEACVLRVPSVQMRKSTERPQVYDVGASVKFDPADPESGPPRRILDRLEALRARSWTNPFGDGKASERIAADLLARVRGGGFRGHQPERSHLNVRHSYRADGLERSR